jgi:hypothetical protein
MTEATPNWQEPMAIHARRKWFRTAASTKVVGAEVIAELRRQRAQRGKLTASTMAGDGASEEAAAAQ